MPGKARSGAHGPAQGTAEQGHDLRQSLQAATVQAHALALQARQQGHAGWAGLAEGMARSLQHCQQLLDGLLAGMTDGQAPPAQARQGMSDAWPAPDWQVLDLAPLLQDLLHAWLPVAQQRGLHLSLDLPAHPPANESRVRGDALWLRRVLDNLVANALAHTTQGGVTVAWRPGGGPGGAGTELTVADTGPGLGPAGPPPPAGHGLGLLIVRRLCQDLGLDWQLSPGPSGGTVARLAWPDVPAAPG